MKGKQPRSGFELARIVVISYNSVHFTTSAYYVCTYISGLTVVENDPKALVLIITTPRCKVRHYAFLWIAPLTLDPYLIMLNVKQGGIKYHFLSLWYDSTWDWTPVYQIISEHSNNYASGPVYVYIYIYIYCHPQRSVWFYLNSSVWLDRLYIYIYREREREAIYIYIYIYIYIDRLYIYIYIYM